MSPKELKELRARYGVSQARLGLNTSISRFRLTSFECGYLPQLHPEEIAKIKAYFAARSQEAGERQ